jgi:phosphatidylglycerophosphatase A
MMTEQRLIFRKGHPGIALLSWFYSGFSPIAPGTCGSLCAIPFAWVIVTLGGPLALLLASCFVFFLGWLLCWWVLPQLNEEDPQIIVIDEVAGQWLTLVIVPIDPLWYCVAFVLFRLADIYKPWPVSLIDRRMKDAFGIMLDDIAAAIYALAGIWIIYLLVG